MSNDKPTRHFMRDSMTTSHLRQPVTKVERPSGQSSMTVGHLSQPVSTGQGGQQTTGQGQGGGSSGGQGGSGSDKK